MRVYITLTFKERAHLYEGSTLEKQTGQSTFCEVVNSERSKLFCENTLKTEGGESKMGKVAKEREGKEKIRYGEKRERKHAYALNSICTH